MKQKILKKFVERYINIVDDQENFSSILFRPLPKAFRVNTLKTSVNNIKERFKNYNIKIKQMAWCEEAFVSEMPRIGETLEHFLGYIYSQELTSMISPLIVKEELKKTNLVLDACAAPGSKTTQMAAIMKNKGLIVANDNYYKRIKALKFNIDKTGTINTAITNLDLRLFPQMEFEIILLDTPCSTEGMTRRNPKALSLWSEKYIKKMSNLQKQLILKGFELLAPNGTLIYSTCTYAPEENEEVVDYLLKNTSAKLEKINIPELKTTKGISEWENKKFSEEVKKTIRIWPHHNNTGGFFIAKIRK